MLWCPDRAISHFRCLKSRSFASLFRSFALMYWRSFATPFRGSHHPFVVSQSRTSAHSLFRIALSQFCLTFSWVCMALFLFRLLVVSQSRNFASPFRCFASPFRCFVVSNFRLLQYRIALSLFRNIALSLSHSFVLLLFRTFTACFVLSFFCTFAVSYFRCFVLWCDG